MSLRLQCIHCDDCDKSWLVGIAEKDIRGKGSGGMYGNDPYMAFGADEVESSPKIKAGQQAECPECGKQCLVENTTNTEDGE